MRRLFLPSGMLGACLAALALVAGTAGAQAEPKRFSVGAQAGVYRFDKASGLENAPFAGIDAIYQLPTFGAGTNGRIEPGIGFYAGVSLPTTDYRQFPVVAFDFGDTTFLYTVAQRVTMLQYGLQGQLGQKVGPARLYAVGGGGMYSMMPDARQTVSRGRLNFTSGMATIFVKA